MVRRLLTSRMINEVNGSKETETREVFEKNIAKQILLRLTSNRQDVTVEEILFLDNWFDKTGNYSEDAAVVVETWLQENDYQIFDNQLYYRQLMEAPNSVWV